MLLDPFRIQSDAVLALSQHYGAQRIRVFGSVARGEEQPHNDIDFLVEKATVYLDF
ncbi:nucleotidyltransferase family protein [Acaryochloris marina]|uniref:nucleotidyltransferase family protein n=1 Tax=Acaryochloris marina TaxID=155978 RepID=UPI001BAF0564|nr:nucleotidyltransferase domain-containing protein [Acaryochloris marina]QUY40691.1 nucleotidyltransferase domain-containing protein [Acaryochloris marina S15]